MKVTMARLQIVGLKTELPAILSALQELGCLHIEDIATQEDISVRPMQPDPAWLQREEQVLHLVSRLEGLLRAFAEFQQEVRPAGAANARPDHGQSCLADAEQGVEVASREFQALSARREALLAEQLSLPRYHDTLAALLPLVPGSAASPENDFAGVMVGRRHQWVLDMLADELLRVTSGQSEMASKAIEPDSLAMIIVFPHRHAPEVETLLGRQELSRLRLPENIESRRPEEAVLAIRRRLEAIPPELATIQAEMSALARAWGPRLQAWHRCLRNALAEMRVRDRLGETERAFVLVGWAPARDVAAIRQALAQVTADRVVVAQLPLTAAGSRRVPVILQNPAVARPFESLTRLLNLPRYEGIDPTLLMALFLPLFFGLILGDAGYGLVLLLLCLAGLRRYRQPGMFRDLLQILALGSGWSILFGILYGELFGTLGEEIGLHALWLDRGGSEEVQSLLLFTIGLGAVHILLGLLLGLFEAVRSRRRGRVLERLGMLLGLVGLFLMVAVGVEQLPAGLMTPGIAVLLVGIAILSASHGWLGLLLGPIEFLGLIGNILSYLRLAAIGLASVYVARLANDLAGTLGSLLLGLLVALLIHALNIALGAFSPTIHSMRLHYVEFYRLFYEGGGRPFEPFQLAGDQER